MPVMISDSPSIGFIGAGRVGTAFGKYLQNNGFNISGYYSRTYSSSREAAEFISCTAFADIGAVIDKSDIIFITVTDSSIAETAAAAAFGRRSLESKTFCHTSGALSSGVLKPLKELGALVCSAHMLIAVSDRFKSSDDFENAFFTAEGDCEPVIAVLEKCGNHFRIIKPEHKAKYHAAAVFASNFVVGLADIACSMLKDCGFTESDALKALSPLMLNNINNIIKLGPRKALTGPASRGDFDTINRHLAVFGTDDRDKAAYEIYKTMTAILVNMAERKEEKQ